MEHGNKKAGLRGLKCLEAEHMQVGTPEAIEMNSVPKRKHSGVSGVGMGEK